MSDSPHPPSRRDALDSTGDLAELIRRAHDADGQPPFSDGSLVALNRDERRLVWLHGVAAAIVSDTEAEFVVDPDARLRGHGRAMLHELLVTASGDLFIWAHGDHPAARALARKHGMPAVRELLQLRAAVGVGAGAGGAVSTGSTHGFRVGVDEDAWVELNARAFAGHPEQGAVTRDDLNVLMAEPWFDADDFLLMWDGEKLVGYCWLKIDGGEVSTGSTSGERGSVGEFYVVGVAPERQGEGLGRRLVEAGLAHLAERGIREASLYVEADNTPALRLYRSFGFANHSIDIQYRWRSEPSDTFI